MASLQFIRLLRLDSLQSKGLTLFIEHHLHSLLHLFLGRHLWKHNFYQQAQKITLFWKHKNKLYLIFTAWRRCCFAFQQPKWVKEKKQHYITFFYISGLQQEHRDMSAGKQVVCPKTLYVVISSSTSQAKVLTADLRTPKCKEVLRDDSRRKKGSKKGKRLWRDYDEVY